MGKKQGMLAPEQRQSWAEGGGGKGEGVGAGWRRVDGGGGEGAGVGAVLEEGGCSRGEREWRRLGGGGKGEDGGLAPAREGNQ